MPLVSTCFDHYIKKVHFSERSFETYLRATSVPEGHEVTPFSLPELVKIRQRILARYHLPGGGALLTVSAGGSIVGHPLRSRR